MNKDFELIFFLKILTCRLTDFTLIFFVLIFHCNIENYIYSVKIGPITASQISKSKKIEKKIFYFFNRNIICDQFLV